jgi:intein/homing endonuclease
MNKFIEQFNSSQWEVETPSGWQDFSGIAKTIEYDEWIVTTESGKFLICADKHIFIDKNWNQVFCEDLVVGGEIQTYEGIEKISSIEITETKSNMYDLVDVNGGNIYYTNDIVSHNTTTVVSYLLHYIVFNDNVNVGILANKASTSREILSRLQLSYENLPKWMQQGIVSWNKGSLELENGSKIIAASTSASAVRGMSFNIIFLDEFAFVPNHIADDFFASVYPTISSGKSTKVIVVSCVTKDTYLLTDKGYRKIESFIDSKKSGAYIVPEYQVRGKDKFYSSDIIVNNKKSPTNIIKTRYETLECSENHKLWSFKDGKYDYFKSNELSVGDYVAIKYNHQVFGNDDYIGFQPEKEKCTNTFSCDYVNEDIAYFVGLYVSEGYARDVIYKKTDKIRGGQIVISCGDDISESLDKINVPYKKIDNVHYVINSKQLVGFLQELGFDVTKKTKEKVLPEKILSWSKKNITALLRGMFDGDGGITKKGIVNYTSTSRELIRQVQLLLANIGILGSIYTTTSAPTKRVKVSSTNHTIEITGKFALEYFNQIGFNLSRKQERISLIKFTNRVGGVTDIVPNSAFVLKECGITRPSGRKKGFSNYSRQLLLSQKEKLCTNEKIIEFFEDNVREDLIWLKIKDITKGEAEVFDVSLPDIEGDKWAHSVLYNNFLGHQTPKGMNHFYRMWHDSERGKNSFVATDVHWSEVPGRDEEWKAQTIANTSEEQFRAEHLCEFLGSVGTLINPSKLKILVYDDPIKKSKGLDVYENPIEDHSYLITVDVARGMGNDYSAFVVFDITEFPYRVVAKYKNNEIRPMLFPSIINEVAKGYDNAWLLIEVNDIGDQVANILHYDLEYDNILMCSMRGRAGQLVGSGFSGKKSQLGVRTTAAVKKLGCSNLKLLIEDDKLFVSDYDIISELTTFAQKHNSFEAEEGCNDDLVMCLVIFAWIVAQDYFKEMTNNDIRKRIYEEQKNQIDQDMSPFGFISDGLEDMEVFVEQETGDRWMFATSENGIQTQEIWNVDEYGDVSSEWDYR